MPYVARCQQGHQWKCAEIEDTKCPKCGQGAVASKRLAEDSPTVAATAAPRAASAKVPAAKAVTRAAAPEKVADQATLPPDPNSATQPSSASGDGAEPSVPGYQIMSELGRGGMGVVYKAKHLQLSRTVALKMILAGGHAGESQLARFRIEAEAVARLQHPGIVQIHETGVHQGLPYFSLEFVEGGSLDRKLNGAPLPAKAAARLTELLAQAMQAAHDKDILHRDLKPGNVFLMPTKDKNGVVIEDRHGVKARYLPKIGDFGLAKKLEAESGDHEPGSASALTQSGSIIGTPSYMAPEQAEGKVGELTAAADTYALGAILYDLLTGRPPFRSATPLETLMQVATEEPVPPAQLNPQTPRDLETICLKCLQKDPKKRYASAQALAEDLERFLNGEPIKARAVGRAERAWRWCRRNPVVAGLIAAVVLVLVGGIVIAGSLAAVALAQAGRARDNEKQALTEKSNAEIAREDARRGEEAAINAQKETAKQKQKADDAATAARAEKDRAERELHRAQWLVYAGHLQQSQRAWEVGNPVQAWEHLNLCQWDLRGWEHDYLYTLYTGNQRSFVGHTSDVHCVAFSPDGKILASGAFGVAGTATVKLWNVETRKEIRTIADPGASVIKRIAFSPDGKRLATAGILASPDPVIARVWNVETGQLITTIRSPKGPDADGVAFAPDGKSLIIARREFPDSAVRSYDAEKGQELSMVKLPGVMGNCFLSQDGSQWAVAAGSRHQEVKICTTATAKEICALTGHANVVGCVAFSVDGKRVATGSGDGTIKVWDASNGKAIVTLKANGQTHSIAFSPDGKRLATADEDWTVKVWDIDRRTLAGTHQGHTDMVLGIAFSPDGKQVASGSKDHTLKLWDTESPPDSSPIVGRLTSEPCYNSDCTQCASWKDGDKTISVTETSTGRQIVALSGHTGAVSVAKFSPDGKRLASGGKDTTVRVWDLGNGHEAVTYKKHSTPVTAVAFSADGRWIASHSGPDKDNKEVPDGRLLHVWDSSSGEDLCTLPCASEFARGHNALTFSPDGRVLAASTGDGHTVLWNLASHEPICSFAARVSCFSPDGKRVAGANPRAASVTVWDAATGKELLAFNGQFRLTAFSPDGKRLVAVFQPAREATVLDVDDGHELVTLPAPGELMHIAFNKEGTKLFYATGDLKTGAWDAGTRHRELQIGVATSAAAKFTWSPDGKLLAGRDFSTVKLWNANTGLEAAALKGHADWVNAICFSPDGKRLASGSRDKTVKIWDLETGAELFTFQHDDDVLSGPEFIADGRRLASADLKGNLKIWDTQTGKEVPAPPGHDPNWGVETWSFAFDAEGKRLATITSKNRQVLKIWDVASGKQLLSIDGAISCVFSRDGKYVVGRVSGANNFKLWDAKTGNLVREFQGHPSFVVDVAYSSDGKQIISSDFSGLVKIWNAEDFKEIASLDLDAYWLSFSPDGKRLVGTRSVSGGKVWRVEDVLARQQEKGSTTGAR